MAKTIGKRTAGIDMSGFKASRGKAFDGQTPTPGGVAVTPEVARESTKSFTGAGIFMAAMAGKDEVSKELAGAQAMLEDANLKLARFDGAIVVRALDPKTVRRSIWANRNEAEFSTPEFLDLKDEIGNAGGNVQPIKVRAVKGVFDRQTPPYEIVFGHRRHQACLELGLLVNAVVVDDMDDQALFEAMDRENRGRKNLSAWEQGRMYDEAIKKGLYSSIRRLVEALGVNLSDAARAVQLAKLPREVVDAFATPLDIQVRWAKPLTDALQSDPDRVLSSAREAGKLRGSISSTEVFERLVGAGVKPSSAEIEISADGKKAATLRAGPKGRVVVEFEAGVLPVERRAALVKLIGSFLVKGV
jgi:ParB family chromosome partitioning protein